MRMADHEYGSIYSKLPNISLIRRVSSASDVRNSSSPPHPVPEELSQVVTSRESPSKSPSSTYDTSHLRTAVSSRVVMVTGLDEAMTMLLNSHGIEGNCDSGGGGGVSGEEGTGGGSYSEGLVMFSDGVQHVSTNYLDFEPADSLHGTDGDVHYSTGNSREDEATGIHENAKSSASCGPDSVSVLEPSRSIEGFLTIQTDDELNASGDNSQQVISVVDLIQTAGPNIFRLVTNSDGTISFVSVSPSQLAKQDQDDEDETDGGVQFMQVQAIDVHAPSAQGLVLPFARTVRSKKLPPGCPPWALTLNDCEKIGDSYRGWVETDAELDAVLSYFRQLTHTYWGTRQSPSQTKPSTRLMWKSQYVPFDGIPFINAGSRAIVMECQYGPRRQSNSKRLSPEIENKKSFKQSCPARVYIKKVRKFPEFSVDGELDKKQLKAAMDNAFHGLKEVNLEKLGENRFYIQLPTEAAHEFHAESQSVAPGECPRRLHPRVSEKLREIVSSGQTHLYAIRNMLRRFVEKELFTDSEERPARHDLTYFPTVNDLQNNIHQAIRDIEVGVLPYNAPLVIGDSVNLEADANSDSSNQQNEEEEEEIKDEATSSTQGPYAQKVTVTLCAKAGEGGQHVITKVETFMSDGRVVTGSSLPPELAHIISNVSQTPPDHPEDTAPNIGETSARHRITEDTSTEDSHSDSRKFSACNGANELKSEIDQDDSVVDVDASFALEGSCDDVVEELCDSDQWTRDLAVGTKRLLGDSNMQTNVCRVKRRKVELVS